MIWKYFSRDFGCDIFIAEGFSHIVRIGINNICARGKMLPVPFEVCDCFNEYHQSKRKTETGR